MRRLTKHQFMMVSRSLDLNRAKLNVEHRISKDLVPKEFFDDDGNHKYGGKMFGRQWNIVDTDKFIIETEGYSFDETVYLNNKK